MATFKYCGQSSGLFSSSHKECEGKHTAGVGELRQMLTRYFQHLTMAADIQHRLQALRKENYLNALSTCDGFVGTSPSEGAHADISKIAP